MIKSGEILLTAVGTAAKAGARNDNSTVEGKVFGLAFAGVFMAIAALILRGLAYVAKKKDNEEKAAEHEETAEVCDACAVTGFAAAGVLAFVGTIVKWCLEAMSKKNEEK